MRCGEEHASTGVGKVLVLVSRHTADATAAYDADIAVLQWMQAARNGGQRRQKKQRSVERQQQAIERTHQQYEASKRRTTSNATKHNRPTTAMKPAQ